MTVRLLHTGKRGQPKALKKSANLRLLTSVPPAPEYFDENRAAIWAEYAAILVDRGDLSEGDLGVLENFVMSLADYRMFTDQLVAAGFTIMNVQGNLVAHPVCNLRRQSEMQMTVAGASLGLSPRGRAAMKREGAPDEQQPEETKKASAF